MKVKAVNNVAVFARLACRQPQKTVTSKCRLLSVLGAGEFFRLQLIKSMVSQIVTSRLYLNLRF